MISFSKFRIRRGRKEQKKEKGDTSTTKTHADYNVGPRLAKPLHVPRIRRPADGHLDGQSRAREQRSRHGDDLAGEFPPRRDDHRPRERSSSSLHQQSLRDGREERQRLAAAGVCGNQHVFLT